MKIKKILPYRHYSLRTKLSAEEVIKRLQENTEPKKIRIFSFLQNSSSKPYEGKVSENSFQISRIIHYRNSFLPVISGEVGSFPGKTEIMVKMRLHNYVLVFISLWLGVVGLSCIGILLFALFNFKSVLQQHYSPMLFIPFVMFAFGFLLTYFAFKKEADIAKAFLVRVLEGEETEN